MAKVFPPKDPEELLDYTIDWYVGGLGRLPSTDVIVSSTWTVPPTITNDHDVFADTTTTIWLADGALDTTYELLNHIVTQEGRELEQTVKIKIKAR